MADVAKIDALKPDPCFTEQTKQNSVNKPSRKQRRQLKKLEQIQEQLEGEYTTDIQVESSTLDEYQYNIDKGWSVMGLQGQKTLQEKYSLKVAQQRITGAKEYLLTSKYYAEFLGTIYSRIKDIGNIKQVVCYGLGSLTQNTGNCVTSQVQLALLLLIIENLKSNIKQGEGPELQVSVYDPVFTEKDELVLQRFNIRVLTRHLDGAYEAVEPMLFYMPHCEGFLYEALYQANQKKLENLVVIGNNLAQYTSGRKSKYLTLAELVKENKVEMVEFPAEKLLGKGDYGEKHHPFNDTCLIATRREQSKV
ncbi:hypothetical protein BB561_006270 [Smittium simulii]|uniref:SRR1-like domain-containing protein n=1 Tax=Smittium simulii TaxID=133385 RepID=A0A2T9Y5H3_9FUNG|nr:hypothetical protein BB561_006270 [Smittium simulii]